MQHDVREIQDRLRHNERIWAAFRQIELQLIGARGLGEIVSALVTGLPRAFAQVSCVRLACVDPEYEVARLLESVTSATHAEPEGHKAEARRSAAESGLVSLSADELTRFFGSTARPYLGPATDEIVRVLFPGHVGEIRSVALVPLMRYGEVTGCLSQASYNARHFSSDSATDLIEHLAAVAALSIDNAVSHERLKADGLTDALTRVANRRLFERRLAEEVERWRRSGEPLSALLVDVDYFKSINDSCGHRVGDEALRAIAQELGTELRAGDVLARYGGEEFVLLFPRTAIGEAQQVAERLRMRIERSFRGRGAAGQGVTVSIGVASLGTGTTATVNGVAALMEMADQALYASKAAGRNCVTVAKD